MPKTEKKIIYTMDEILNLIRKDCGENVQVEYIDIKESGDHDRGTYARTINSITLLYPEIPTTLEEAVRYLKDDLTSVDITKIKSGELNPPSLHHSLGQWIRNNWGLWSGSKLRDYFFELGLFHADDMSGMILDKLKQDVLGNTFNITSKVNQYIKFWEEQKVNCNEEITKLKAES